MHNVKYGMFFDNHTHFDNPDVGKEFDVEQFTDNLKACGADYLGFHARCNQGMAYYNTKIGTRHPALTYDLFGKLAEACKRKDIALVAYFNGGLSTMEGVAHTDWRTMHMPGHEMLGKPSPHTVSMCFNSPYRDHLIAMIKEVAENYPVQGFFIDCLINYPCVCPTCVESMKQQGLDWTDFKDVQEHTRRSVLRLCKDIYSAVKTIIPDPMMFFNGPVFGTVRDLDTFFDCECLPTAGWGYEFLPTMAHYIRNIVPGKQILNMTGRFYDWGDFGGLRGKTSLEFDMFYGLAHGMRPNIAGHFHPRGDRDQAVFDRIKEVYDDLRVYDNWHLGAENLADVAVLYPEDNVDLRLNQSVISAVRMLDELKIQFDLVLADCEKSWDQYKLLILPEQVEITPELEKRLQDALSKGIALFACGKNAAEKFGKELGVRYTGDFGETSVYFNLSGKLAEGIEPMYHSLYASASAAELDGAEMLSPLVKAYCKKGWNGRFAYFYAPPQAETTLPFLTKKDNRIWCSGDLFAGYYERGALHLRELLNNIIHSLLPHPLLDNETLPGFVRSTVTEQPGRINVNLIAYAPERRGNATVVEDPMAVLDGVFKLNLSGKQIKSATLAPNGTPVEYSVENGIVRIKVPPFKGFALISLETE